jgi:hypothetical protein
MPPVKQLSCARSQPRVRVPHLLVAHASPERSPDYDKAQLAFPQQDVSRHPVSAYQSMAETVARFALYAGSTFPHLLLAIFSWLTAEFLAGCAAYVQDVSARRHCGGARWPWRARADDGLTAQGAPSLISGKTTWDIESIGRFLLLEQTQPCPGAPFRVKHRGRPTQQAPNTPPRCYSPISSIVMMLLLNPHWPTPTCGWQSTTGQRTVCAG